MGMSTPTRHGYDKALKKEIDNCTVYLYKACDLTHGIGWYCHVYDLNSRFFGFGFSSNRFTAFRNAFSDANKNRYRWI